VKYPTSHSAQVEAEVAAVIAENDPALQSVHSLKPRSFL
jgi:hypothetical protein